VADQRLSELLRRQLSLDDFERWLAATSGKNLDQSAATQDWVAAVERLALKDGLRNNLRTAKLVRSGLTWLLGG